MDEISKELSARGITTYAICCIKHINIHSNHAINILWDVRLIYSHIIILCKHDHSKILIKIYLIIF